MAKSLPGSLRGFQNRPKIDPESVFGVVKAPKELAGMIRSVPNAARDHPGSTRRVPKSVPVVSLLFVVSLCEKTKRRPAPPVTIAAAERADKKLFSPDLDTFSIKTSSCNMRFCLHLCFASFFWQFCSKMCSPPSVGSTFLKNVSNQNAFKVSPQHPCALRRAASRRPPY